MDGERTWLRRSLGLAVCVAVGSAAAIPAEAGPSAAADPTSCAAATPAGGADYVIRIPTATLPLRVLVHVPRRSAGHRLPLLLAFHGAGGTGPFMRRYSGLGRLSDAAGFAVAFPSAPSPVHSWQLHDEPGRDDVAAVASALDVIEARSCVDTGRVFATGVSNGGGFTARLGCALPERIAGIAVVAGGFRAVDPCPVGPPVSVLEIHGTDDGVVPYRGREDDGHAGAVLPWVRRWAARDGCGPHALVRRRGRVLQRWRWTGCAAGVRVRHVAIVGGEHGWPGATPPDPGPSPVSSAREVWGFLGALPARR